MRVETLRFGPYQLDPAGRALLRDGTAVPLDGFLAALRTAGVPS